MSNLYDEKLKKMTNQELIDIAENTLFSQILMIRRIPTQITNLNTGDKNYKNKRNRYAKLIIDLGDNAHNLPNYIKEVNRKGLLFELTAMIEFLMEIQKDKHLLVELNAHKIVEDYKSKDLL